MVESKNEWNLLPCPFCGGRPELRVFPHPMNDIYNQVVIQCTKCHAKSNVCVDGRNLKGVETMTSQAVEKVVFQWNRRYQTKDIVGKLNVIDKNLSGVSFIVKEISKDVE